ncbi:redoxin family protein [bacterium]|nr:redoxin family protein [bacterium]
MPRTLPILLLVVSLAVAAGATEREVALDEFDLAEYRGQVVVVDFWASWCPPCREAMPFLSDMQDKYGDQGLVTVAVNVDQDPKAPGKMIARLHDEIIVVRDPRGTLAQEHGVRGLPTALVLDREGNVVATHVGFHASEKGPREKELQRLLATGGPQG